MKYDCTYLQFKLSWNSLSSLTEKMRFSPENWDSATFVYNGLDKAIKPLCAEVNMQPLRYRIHILPVSILLKDLLHTFHVLRSRVIHKCINQWIYSFRMFFQMKQVKILIQAKNIVTLVFSKQPLQYVHRRVCFCKQN